MEHKYLLFCCPEDPNVDAKLLLEKSGVIIDTYVKAAKIALGQMQEENFLKIKEFLEANGFVITESRKIDELQPGIKPARKKTDGTTSFSSDDYHEAYGNSVYGPS